MRFADAAALHLSGCHGQFVYSYSSMYKSKLQQKFRLGCHELPVDMGRHVGVLLLEYSMNEMSLGLVGNESM